MLIVSFLAAFRMPVLRVWKGIGQHLYTGARYEKTSTIADMAQLTHHPSRNQGTENIKRPQHWPLLVNLWGRFCILAFFGKLSFRFSSGSWVRCCSAKDFPPLKGQHSVAAAFACHP